MATGPECGSKWPAGNTVRIGIVAGLAIIIITAALSWWIERVVEGESWADVVLCWTTACVLSAAALWIALVAIFADRARGRRRCPKCWYDMAAVHGLTCPECGHDARRARRLRRTRRRWRRVALAFGMLVGAAVLVILPKARRDGLPSVMPNTALILCLRLPDNRGYFAELERRTSSDVYGIGFPTADPATLPRWQWRLIGDQCLALRSRDLSATERNNLLRWLSSAFSLAEDEAADRFYEAMVAYLGDDVPRVRQTATVLCATRRRPERGAAVVGPMLDDPDPQVRSVAMLSIGRLACANDHAMHLLLGALEHEDDDVRASAASRIKWVVAECGPPPDLLDTMLAMYRSDPSPAVRGDALKAACALTTPRAATTPLLRAAMASPEEHVRTSVGDWLSLHEQYDEHLELDVALAGLTDASAGVRSNAAYLLGRVSSALIRPHEDRLRELRETAHEDVEHALRSALERIGNEAD